MDDVPVKKRTFQTEDIKWYMVIFSQHVVLTANKLGCRKKEVVLNQKRN